MHCFGCNSELVAESRTCKTCGRPVESDPDKYFKAGMEACADDDLDRSIELLMDCVNLAPDHLSGRYNLGMALALANRCDEAMEHYYAVADQEPNYPGIYTALGQAAFGSYMTHTAEAESGRKMMIHMLMKAIEQDPEDVDACFSLANAYVALGKAEKALPLLKRALTLHPDSSAIYFVIAKAFKTLQKYPEAAIMAQKSMQLSVPNDMFHDDIEELLSELQQTVLEY